MQLSRPLQFSLGPALAIAGEGWGDPHSSPVVLLHGGGQTRHSWGDSVRLIAEQGWYAITLDARGHEDSSCSAEAHYQVEYLVEDLLGVLQQMGKNRKPALVGASTGGLTALLAAGENRGAICSALVLVDIAPRIEPKGIERILLS